ncbi:tyrosine-type recombinase/integrase [Nostoc sp.]|uniref:tyrosine-type recombinase/integrase n=1 Tax=Nostoc sp. TaxID=1180 RepID=UPI002FF63B35
MILDVQKTELFEILSDPENIVFPYITDVRLQRDVWNIEQDLPLLREQAYRKGRKTINFEGIVLEWLKELIKLAVLVAVGNRHWGLNYLTSIISTGKNFSIWLVNQGYITLSVLDSQVVSEWAETATQSQKANLSGLFYVLNELSCIQFKIQINQQCNKHSEPPQIIPEEVKHKIDLALEQLDKPIYLIFKLHEGLGTRCTELAKIPLNCLRNREGIHRIRLCTGKQNDIEQEQDIPEEFIPLVHQQQAFVREHFGDTFPWLFPNWSSRRPGFNGKGCKGWPLIFKYHPEQIKQVYIKLNQLLKSLIKENDIRTNDGNLAHITTHMFRRTYATVADRMGKRPDLIQHGLRHTNSDMQDSYVYVSPQQQEKRIHRVLVNKDGERTTIYSTDQDSEFIRKEWTARQVELGLCTRPSIQDECKNEYVCLGCKHIRFTQEHLLKLIEIKQTNQRLLDKCMENNQSDSRRANSARKFIHILNPIIANLQQ